MKFSPFSLLYGLVVSTLVVATLYFFQASQDGTRAVNEGEAEETVVAVGRIMELPSGEELVIMTVEDKSKLDRRVFPERVENGDRLLVYRLAGLVILYRPSSGKIIDTSSVPPLPEVTAETSVNPSTLTLYVATDDAERVAAVEEQIKREFPNLSVEVRENAQRRTYSGIFVYNPSFFQSALAEELEAKLGGTFEETLPIGERVPSTDLLIIIGDEPQSKAE